MDKIDLRFLELFRFNQVYKMQSWNLNMTGDINLIE
jgi:hypothetical protein